MGTAVVRLNARQNAWPEWDPDIAELDTVTMVIHANSKVRHRIEVPANIPPDDAQHLALEAEPIEARIEGKPVRRVVARPQDS